VKSAVRPEAPTANAVNNKPIAKTNLSPIIFPIGAAIKAPTKYPAALAVFIAPASAKLQPRALRIGGSRSA
jgi:hypothetical protein